MGTFVKCGWSMRPRGQCLVVSVLIVLAIVLIVGGGIAVWLQWEWLRSSEEGKASNGDTLRNVGFIVAGVVALAFAFWRARVAERQADAAQSQVGTAQQGLLNERYQRGAEMLASGVLTGRLGGIYALQRLAEEHAEQYEVQIVRLLCAFVRDPDGNTGTAFREPVTSDKAIPHSLRQDVQAAVEGISSVLARGTFNDREPDTYVDLRGARLNGVHLEGGDLSGADLTHAQLVRADLENTTLRGAQLRRTQLQDSILRGTDLTGVTIFRADLEKANLIDATLDKAVVIGVNLHGTLFNDTSLAFTVFSETRVTQAQLDRTKVNPQDPPVFLDNAVDPSTSEPLRFHGEPLG